MMDVLYNGTINHGPYPLMICVFVCVVLVVFGKNPV